MKILRAYKTELDPNNAQIASLLNHAGAARWAFNWGLRRKQEVYKAWVDGGKQEKCKTPSAIDLHRELNALKKLPREEGGVPWMYEVSKCAPQEALRNLDNAYAGFFRRCKQGAKKKGFPQRKERKRGIGSFTLTGAISATSSTVQLPRLGDLRIKERNYLPVDGAKILKATVSEKNGRWFVSLQVEQEINIEKRAEHIVGVDVGINNLAVTSDGVVFENPQALRSAEHRLRLLQKAVSRKRDKKSQNRKKVVKRLSKQHYRLSCVRKDAIHKATTAIAKQASIVVIEDLNVAGMFQNHCLARSISDAGLAEFHRQIKYKMAWNGGVVLEADRFYPSSKKCSGCGNVKIELSLSERLYVCEKCGLRIDRDLNAAINLKMLAGSSPVAACCPGSAGLDRKIQTKLLVGQEPNTVESCAG